MKITVTVTQEHHDRAESARKCGDPRHRTCDIAQAFWDLGYTSVSVGSGTFTLNSQMWGSLPLEARQLTRDVDFGHPVKFPIAFEVNAE